MIGAVIGCGLAAIGGAAIGSFLGTANGVATGVRLARECSSGGSGVYYNNYDAWKRDRELLKKQIKKREQEHQEIAKMFKSFDERLDFLCQMEQLNFYLNMMTEAEKVTWRNAVYAEMQIEQEKEAKRIEAEKQPTYENMVETARSNAHHDDDSYYGEKHRIFELCYEFKWWNDCRNYLIVNHQHLAGFDRDYSVQHEADIALGLIVREGSRLCKSDMAFAAILGRAFYPGEYGMLSYCRSFREFLAERGL